MTCMSPERARALVDQSGECYNPVPILMRYGEPRGLTAAAQPESATQLDAILGVLQIPVPQA
jgi:hypothetical protein